MPAAIIGLTAFALERFARTVIIDGRRLHWSDFPKAQVRMMSSRALLVKAVLILAALVFVSPGLAASNSWVVRPPSAWVEEIGAMPVQDSSTNSESGIIFLLSDNQFRFNGSSTERYYRRVKKVLKTSALESVSQLSFDFEPSFEQLIIHHIRIIRGGRTIDALRPKEIKVIQEETELDQQLFNGTLSALVFLNDVRAGDVIDYAYTLNGDNPILGGRFADSFNLSESEPVGRIRWRLLWPAGRTLHYRGVNTDAVPAVRAVGNQTEYTWERLNVPPLLFEDATPGWFNPSPAIYMSEFATWEELVAWARPLYQIRSPLDAKLARQIDQWRSIEGAPNRMLAALRFVQDEIRYTGIEMGPHSHLPNPPGKVLERRFGDCKDKSFLLCAILNSLGIEAYPALVNTQSGHMLADKQPSPFSFDHVIVQTRVDDVIYWVDPTIPQQRGGLGDLQNPDYERALVVREGAKDLEEIPLPSSATPTISVKDRFTVEGYDRPASFEVVTTYRGADANAARYELAQNPISETGRMHLNYYADRYASIEAEGPIQIADDAERNVVVVTEKYKVPNFWKDKKAYLAADRIKEELQKPAISKRSMPLGIRYPANVNQTIEVKLPAPYTIPTESGTIEDDAMRLRYEWRHSGDVIRLDYNLTTLRDHVTAEKVARHLETIDDAQKVLTYEIEEGGAAISWWVVIPLLGLLAVPVVLIGTFVGVRRALNRQRRNRFKESSKPLPGASPETAFHMSDGNDFAAHLGALCRWCATPRYRGDAELHREGFVYDGRRFTVVRFACEGCGRSQDVYFDGVVPLSRADGD